MRKEEKENKMLALLLLLLYVSENHPIGGESYNEHPVNTPSTQMTGGVQNTPSNRSSLVNSLAESSLLTIVGQQTGGTNENRMAMANRGISTTETNKSAILTLFNQDGSRNSSAVARTRSEHSAAPTPASRNDENTDDLIPLTGSTTKLPTTDEFSNFIDTGFTGNGKSKESRSEDDGHWNNESTSWIPESSYPSQDQRYTLTSSTSTPFSKHAILSTGAHVDDLARDVGMSHRVNNIKETGETFLYPDYGSETTEDHLSGRVDWSRPESSSLMPEFGPEWERNAQKTLFSFQAQCRQMQQERQARGQLCDGTQWNVIKTAEFCRNFAYCSTCGCEDDCYEEDSCCIEKMIMGILSLKQPKPPGCHNTFITPHKKTEYFSMVDYCQSGWGEDQVFEDCTNVSSQDVHGQWPVWSPASEVTYRNQHCAACHGEDPDILQPWDLAVFCEYATHWETFTSLQDVVKKISDTPGCVLGFNPPKDSSVESCSELELAGWKHSACPANTTYENVSSMSWFHRACDVIFRKSPSGKSLITPWSLPCALCNMAHYGSTCFSAIDTPFPFMLVMSAKALLNVTSAARSSCACSTDEMYDTYESRCRKVYCSTAKTLKGSRCVPAVKRLKGIGYELNLRLTPVNVSLPVVIDDVFYFDDFANETLAVLQRHVLTKSLENKFFQLVFRVESIGDSDLITGEKVILKEVDLKLQTGIKYLADLQEVEDRLLTVIRSRLTFTVSTAEESRIYWVHPLFLGKNKAKWFHDESDIHSVKYGVDRVFSNGRFSDYAVNVHDLLGFGGHFTDFDEYQLVQNTLNCTKVSFNLSKHVQGEQLESYSNPLMQKTKHRSEQMDRFAHSLNERSGEIVLSLDRETGEVYHAPSGHTVGFQHVELGREGEVVLVCVDQLYGPRRPLSPPALVLEKFFSTHMIYVSVACQSLSVVCLFLVLLTYCLFAELRTLPGKNTMGMVTSLFLAMLLFEVGVARVEMPALCTLLGVLIHLALLSAFTWMVLCSLHMHRVFTHVLASRHLRQPEAQSSLFVKHVLISLLVPAVIVAGTMLGNWLARGTDGGCWKGEEEKSEGVDVGYGRGICYVSNPLSLLLASVLPVCVAVGVNVLLFLFTVRSLRHLGQDALQATQQQRQQLALYFRLSTLTGINWLVGPATTIIDSVIVGYIFIVLCGLQGVYVFVAFVCNRRVLSLYRTLFDCKKEAESESAAQLPDTGSTPLPPEEIDTKVKRKISAD